MKVAGKKKLEFLAIQRTDNKEWAIPGVRTSQYMYTLAFVVAFFFAVCTSVHSNSCVCIYSY